MCCRDDCGSGRRAAVGLGSFALSDPTAPRLTSVCAVQSRDRRRHYRNMARQRPCPSGLSDARWELMEPHSAGRAGRAEGDQISSSRTVGRTGHCHFAHPHTSHSTDGSSHASMRGPNPLRLRDLPAALDVTNRSISVRPMLLLNHEVSLQSVCFEWCFPRPAVACLRTACRRGNFSGVRESAVVDGLLRRSAETWGS